MKIKLTKIQKIALLEAIKTGIFDTTIFVELANLEPARILTPKEAKEFISKVEESC